MSGQSAGIAKGAEELRRIEAEAPGYAERPRPRPVQRSAQSLRRVLDDEQSRVRGQPQEPVHVAEPSVEVHGHDGPRAGRDGRRQSIHVHEVVFADVDQHGSGARVVNGRHRCHEGVGDGDDLLSGPDACRA